jgi:hypothetical protein
MIKPEEVRDERARLGCASHASFTVKLGRGLVSHEMVTSAEHEIRDYQARRVLGALHERRALLRSRERGTEIARPHEKPIQAVKKLQLVTPVAERLLKRKSALDRGANLVGVSAYVHNARAS